MGMNEDVFIMYSGGHAKLYAEKREGKHDSNLMTIYDYF